MTLFNAKQRHQLNRIDTHTESMKFGDKIGQLAETVETLVDLGEDLQEQLALSVPFGTPVNAANASAVLTFANPVIHGEKLIIGDDVYEMAANDALSVSDPANIVVDITAYAGKAVASLTVGAQPTAGDTMTIGGKLYTFVPDGTANADGEISIGTDILTAQAAIVAGINGTDGHNLANTLVSASDFETNVSTIMAFIAGTQGNLIALEETFDSEANLFSGANLITGTDCIALNAITALVAAITASDTVGVTAVADNATIILTHDVAGIIGNLVEVESQISAATFGVEVTTLEGGIDGTEGIDGETMYDTSWFYVCTDVNTIADKNWRRITLGAAF